MRCNICRAHNVCSSFIQGELIMTTTEQSTVKAFIDTDKNTLDMPLPTSTPAPSHEQIKHTLIGSRRAVASTIKVLHELGYAPVGDWSPLLPSTNPLCCD